MSKRSVRRHHRARMIARARRVTRRWYPLHEPVDHTEADEQAVRIADHLAVCSCAACGNPRRNRGYTALSFRSEALTVQERRSALDLLEWEDDLDVVV